MNQEEAEEIRQIIEYTKDLLDAVVTENINDPYYPNKVEVLLRQLVANQCNIFRRIVEDEKIGKR